MVFKKFFNIDDNRGITLIEIVVTIVIIMFFSMVLIADFPKIQKQYALSSATYKLAEDLRKTEDMGLSGILTKNSTGVSVAKGYGISITSSSNTYIIYADVDLNHKYTGDFTTLCINSASLTADCIVQKIDITNDISQKNPNLYIKSIQTDSGSGYIPNISPISINFTPPDPTVNISDSSNGYNGIKINLGFKNDVFTGKTILVNTSGLIDVQ